MNLRLGQLWRAGPAGPTVLAVLAAALLIGLGLGQAFRDTTPPSLWTEAPERWTAGERFELFLSADEPVRYQIDYGSTTVEAVEQDHSLALTAQPGVQPLRIRAVDGAGNASDVELQIEGVVVPDVTLEASGAIRPGSPFTASIHFDPADAPASVDAFTIAGSPVVVHAGGALRYAFGAVPLTEGAGTISLELIWTDGLGRQRALAESVTYEAPTEEVEELRIDSSTLAVITPEGRALEEAALAAAKADADEPPRWSEPFLMPVVGHGSSGFGRARRYAPGGPVSFHRGEDVAAPSGTQVRATNDGVVLLAGNFPIKGGLTIIDHGAGITSRYYHQSRIDVSKGQTVVRGEVIGAVGSSGLSTGPHLHWEMRVGDLASDPLAWVGQVRP